MHMNTPSIQKLEAGEAFDMPWRGASSVVLTEGELLVQPPMQWLADTVFVPPSERLEAPAIIPVNACSLIALRPSFIEVTQKSPQILQVARHTVFAWLRVVWRNPSYRGR